jgi:predicted nucleic acid-binding Zn ribbon protein
MSPQSTCLECKESMVGRSDKKFCSDYCRNAFNNRQNSDSNKLVRNINNTLRKNRRVLEKLNPNEKTKSTRDTMLSLGFNFNYHTHLYTTKTGSNYLFCYEYGYLMLENDEVLIVKRDTDRRF